MAGGARDGVRGRVMRGAWLLCLSVGFLREQS